MDSSGYLHEHRHSQLGCMDAEYMTAAKSWAAQVIEDARGPDHSILWPLLFGLVVTADILILWLLVFR